MTHLTANVIARAVVASARSYGKHPLDAFEARSGAVRRPITAAALGLHLGLKVPISRAARLLGCAPNAVSQARGRQEPAFLRAVEAAKVAARTAHHGCAPFQAPPEPPPAPAKPSTADLLAKAIRERARATPAPVETRPAPEPRRDAPHAPVRFQSPPVLTELTIGARILRELSERPLSGASLASVLGEKENIVLQALSVLRHEGRIACDAPPPEGERYKAWRVVEGAAA